MNYLDRNVLPKFQERLDLAASELNDMEDIFVEAINEIAGRVHIINNLVPAAQRSQFAEEQNYLIIDKITQLTNQMTNLNQEMATLRSQQAALISTVNANMLEFERRLNILDDAAARKEDLNVLLWRSGQDEIETI